MKNKYLNLIKFFLVMVFLVILLAVLILGFCWFFYLLPIDFPGTVGEWITGLSTLSGGALTLVGVWWSINDNENQRKSDLSIQYKPNLTLININNTKNNIFNTITILNHKLDFPDLFQQDLDEYPNDFFVTFENTGRGNITDLQIKNELLDADPIMMKNLEIPPLNKNHYLAKDHQITLKLSFPLGLIFKRDYIFREPISIKYSLSFYDEFHYKQYSYTFLINVIFIKIDDLDIPFKHQEEFPFYFNYELLNYSFYEQ